MLKMLPKPKVKPPSSPFEERSGEIAISTDCDHGVTENTEQFQTPRVYPVSVPVLKFSRESPW